MPKVIVVTHHRPEDTVAEDFARQVPRFLRKPARWYAKQQAAQMFHNAGLSPYTVVEEYHSAPQPQPQRRPRKPPPASAPVFHPYAQGYAAYQPRIPVAPTSFHLGPRPHHDPIGAALHDRLNQIQANLDAAGVTPGQDPHPMPHQPPPYEPPMSAREREVLDRAIELSREDAATGTHGIDPARVHNEQQAVAQTLKRLRDVDSLPPTMTPLDALEPWIQEIYAADPHAYHKELSAEATRTDRIELVLNANGLALVPNTGKTQQRATNAPLPRDEAWAVNNCLLISLMQHATGDYHSDHAALVNQFREIIEQDPSLGIKPGEKLPAYGKVADAIVDLINGSLGVEPPMRMVTVSDAGGVIHIESAGAKVPHGRDVMVVDMGGHFEAAAPRNLIDGQRPRHDVHLDDTLVPPPYHDPASQHAPPAYSAAPTNGATPPATPPASDLPPAAQGMQAVAHSQMQSTLIQQAQQIANTDTQRGQSMVALTADATR